MIGRLVDKIRSSHVHALSMIMFYTFSVIAFYMAVDDRKGWDERTYWLVAGLVLFIIGNLVYGWTKNAIREEKNIEKAKKSNSSGDDSSVSSR